MVTASDLDRLIAQRDDVRRAAAGWVAVFITVALWTGFVATSRVALWNGPEPNALDLVLELVGFVIALGAGWWLGTSAWILVAERRRPWPFGPRRREVVNKWSQIPFVVALVIVGAFSLVVWPPSVMLAADGLAEGARVHLPANEARRLILSATAGMSATLLVMAARHLVVARRRRPAR
jgi:hypothetical protein